VLSSGFDDGGHGPFGTGHAPVGAVGMNLIAAEVGLLTLAGHDDGAAGVVDLYGVIEGLAGGHDEELLKHFDDVFVGMVVVVEENDVEKRGELIARFAGDVGLIGCTGHLLL